MEKCYTVSGAPHIKSDISTKKIIWSVAISLVPAGAAGAVLFGIRSIYIIAVSVMSAAIAELGILALRKKDAAALYDGSAVLTGLLLAYNLPPGVPLWMPAAGSIFAIAIGKQAFGPLGRNIFNPALAGMAFLALVWPAHIASRQNPWWKADAVTNKLALLGKVSNLDLFIGNRPGCIGEVCVLALLIGAAFLFIKRYITWHIPFSYIAAVGILSWVFNGRGGPFTGDTLFFILSGGLVLGAFFMATDYVTSPLSARGKVIFGIGCGILTFLIRKFSRYPEGVCYAILIMNALVPLIDKYTFPKWFGYKPLKYPQPKGRGILVGRVIPEFSLQNSRIKSRVKSQLKSQRCGY